MNKNMQCRCQQYQGFDCVFILRHIETWPKDAFIKGFCKNGYIYQAGVFLFVKGSSVHKKKKTRPSHRHTQNKPRRSASCTRTKNFKKTEINRRGIIIWDPGTLGCTKCGRHYASERPSQSVCKGIQANASLCLRMQAAAAASRPLPGPSEADRAGEFSFGRLELGGPTSSRFSAMVALSPVEHSGR